MARDLAIRPAYVTTPQGQLRVWQVGEGPPCVVLPGLINGAEVIASRLAASNPPVNAVVVELPGLGGSAGVWPSGIGAVAGAVAAALQGLGSRGRRSWLWTCACRWRLRSQVQGGPSPSACTQPPRVCGRLTGACRRCPSRCRTGRT